MDLKATIKKLEAENLLTRVHTPVDPAYELAGVAKKLEGKAAVLFEKVKGYDTPILTGVWWNRENVAKLFDTTAQELPNLFAHAMSHKNNILPTVLVENAPAQAVIMPTPDLSKLPVPKLALLDGGAFFSNSIVIAKDPDTGVRNTSVHRLMVTANNRMTMLMDVGRHLRDYYERAEKQNKPLEITISNGVDAAIYVAAITPSGASPIDQDELSVAATLRGKPVELCASKTVAVEGIANAQFIIEAEILPHIRESDGPFGEVSGYYAEQDQRWVVHVKAITHQKNPIFHSLLPGMEVWNSVGLTAEANIFQSVSRQIPGLKNVYLSPGGCGFYGAIIQIDPPRNGMAKNAILSTFAAFPPLQMVTAINSDIDIYDSDDIARAMATRLRPDQDVMIIPPCFGHELNPATDKGFGSKIGFDCTYPLPKEAKFNRVTFQEVNLADYDLS